MMERPKTRNQKKFDRLCKIRRPLTDREIDEIKRLRIAIWNTNHVRERYANDPEYRAARIASAMRTKIKRRQMQVAAE